MSVAGCEWRAEVHLTVGSEDALQLRWRGSGRVARRQCGSTCRDRAVSDHSFEPRRGAEHEHARSLAIHAKGVRDAHRDDSSRASLEPEALPARLNSEPSLEHDVTLVLRMRVKRWGRVAGKEELDQREAPLSGRTCHPDRCERAEKPELLALTRT